MEEETNQQTNKQKKGRTDSLPPPKEERARIRYKENQICSIHVSIGVAIIVIGGCNSAVTRTNLKVEMYVPRCIYIYTKLHGQHMPPSNIRFELECSREDRLTEQ